MRLIEYKDTPKFYIQDDYDATLFTFEDDRGKVVRWTPLGIYDPEIHMRLTTYRSAIIWWVNNREAIFSAASRVHCSGDVQYNACKYFDYSSWTNIQTATVERLKEDYAGGLMEPSLQFQRGGRESRGSTSWFLVKQPTIKEEVFPRYSVSLRYKGYIQLIETEVEQNTVLDLDYRWTRIHNYSYRMSESEYNWFRTDAKESAVFFGMELELSTKLSTDEIQYIVTQVEPKQEPFFIFKSDSSVSGMYRNKVELVTVPCTPRYLRKNWKLFFSKLEKLVALQGKTIEDFFDTANNLNNGLHIHVSKDSFLDKPHTNKFLTAWHQWDDDAVSIIADASCRPRKYTEHSYCMPDPNYKRTAETGGRTLGIAKFERQVAQRSLARRLKGMRVENRGTAHDGNAATIEVRVYQGIFDIGHIMRSISFTEAMFEYTQNIGYQGFDSNFARAFTNFIRKNSKFKAIHNIFKYGKGEAQCA